MMINRTKSSLIYVFVIKKLKKNKIININKSTSTIKINRNEFNKYLITFKSSTNTYFPLFLFL